MTKFLITKQGEVKDLGLAPSYTKEGNTLFIPLTDHQMMCGFVQQGTAPTDEQIADVVARLCCPAEVKFWRVKRVLQRHLLWDALMEWINAIGDADTKATVLCAMENGADVQRNSPTVLGAKVALSLTDRQINDLFIQAAALEV